jgi:hypothetical protein
MAVAYPSFDELISTPLDQRDADWEALFLREFPMQKVRVIFPDAKPGPDGWPYLFVESQPAQGKGGAAVEVAGVEQSAELDGDEPVLNILEWLSIRGIGLVLNPQKPTPDFVLTYGMIWNFRERGSFVSTDSTASAPKSGEFRLNPGEQVLTGAPSETYLPKYARQILKQFFLDQGVIGPKVLMVSGDKVHYDLCFSLESLGRPPVKEHAGIAEAIAWFLPAHYSVALISEKTVPGFQPL